MSIKHEKRIQHHYTQRKLYALCYVVIAVFVFLFSSSTDGLMAGAMLLGAAFGCTMPECYAFIDRLVGE